MPRLRAYAHSMANNFLDSWKCDSGPPSIYDIVERLPFVLNTMVSCRDNKHPSTFRPRKNTPMGSKVMTRQQISAL